MLSCILPLTSILATTATHSIYMHKTRTLRISKNPKDCDCCKAGSFMMITLFYLLPLPLHWILDHNHNSVFSKMHKGEVRNAMRTTSADLFKNPKYIHHKSVQWFCFAGSIYTTNQPKFYQNVAVYTLLVYTNNVLHVTHVLPFYQKNMAEQNGETKGWPFVGRCQL